MTLHEPNAPYKVVDLFAGPGGLAEGFSRVRSHGRKCFEIALSVEKEPSAFATLRLRAFTRQFSGRLPVEYYEYISGHTSLDALTAAYPKEWEIACKETWQLELGTSDAARILDPLLDNIREQSRGNAILVGGPPCQAYSLVGRARNRGNASYVAGDDQRHFLYKEYIRILERLKPCVFIMENVKGFLSSTVNGERIFAKVLDDLSRAGGSPGTYRIVPLTQSKERSGQQFVLQAERYGVPQRRHRVILVGIRNDVPLDQLRLLQPSCTAVTTADALASLPRLRSGLSKSEDSPAEWKMAVGEAFEIAAAAAEQAGAAPMKPVAVCLRNLRHKFEGEDEQLPRSSSRRPLRSNTELGAWLSDPDLQFLPNHATRGHMKSDLARYAYAAAFALVHDRSPKADEFPKALAPSHANWETGKFADRFRVQLWNAPSTTVTSHISKDGHYFIHPDPLQCRSLTVREAARLQTFPDNYFFEGNRTQQFVQVGNAVPPLLAQRIASAIHELLCGQSDAGSHVAEPDDAVHVG